MSKVEKDLIKTLGEVKEFIFDKTRKLSTEESRGVLNSASNELVIKG